MRGGRKVKNILITGAGSYVGGSVAAYLMRWPESYRVDTLDMIGDGWRQADFSGYDAVLHVAGIVHNPKTKDDPAQRSLYEQVNTLLAIETARKAKAEGVKQFLFMSTAGVYGISGSLSTPVTITKDTPLAPRDNYGISKAKAEEGILALRGDGFQIVILRPPMIYGKGCKGNYITLAKLAKKLPVFPWVSNQRSMLYIENFAEFVRLMVDNEEEGTFCPQNNEYTNTSEMVRQIAAAGGKRIWMVRGFTWALKLLRHGTGLVDKAFGNWCYDWALSRYEQDYCVKNLAESIRETES